jgi:hypothetical protein
VRLRLAVEKFVGGGFAGQVYRAKLLEAATLDGPIVGLEVGGTYAVKVLIPPSAKARRFRDFLYNLGFQSPFLLQVNPSAIRAGALWQKFIRRAAGLRFGEEQAVVDVFATFVDPNLGGCGEVREWVEGRNWRFEVDDRLSDRWRWRPGEDQSRLGAPEYRAKKVFMAEFVRLLDEMGATELARQYEWWTCKSQPNVLKRLAANDEPEGGLTAVDFRPGLALLPLLPMSPGDVKLILKGLARGSLVQFDRGDVGKLQAFIDAHGEHFVDMKDALVELKDAEQRYRDSQVDITHNHVRLLYSRRLWSAVLDSVVVGFQVRRVTDEAATGRLRSSRLLTLAFMALALTGFLGVVGGAAALVAGLAAAWPFGHVIVVTAALGLVVPVACNRLLRILGRADYRKHLWRALTSRGYLRRAVEAHIAEAMIGWHRAGRVDARRAAKIAAEPWRFLTHLPLSVLPVFLHRLLSDWRYALGVMKYIVVRPIQLYFDPQAREQWLRDTVAEGRRLHMLTDQDADGILARIKDQFIQKYLKALAVHVCTLPVTQIVSVSLAYIYVKMHPEFTWQEASAAVALILIAFQVTPVSPGSLVRGLYVLCLVVRERNFKDYNIAVFLAFLKYIGYLAFPIQMAYRYPVLARFMAAHWATGAVHVIPVFGEHGALLEHGVFDLFYNYPLTVRRRMHQRAALRWGQKARTWHAILAVAAGLAAMAITDVAFCAVCDALPTLLDVWPAAVLVPVMLGAATTIGAGGASLARRVRLTIVCAVAMAIGYTAVHAALGALPALGGVAGSGSVVWLAVKKGLWTAFIFAVLATVSALVTEINLPEPKARESSDLDALEEPKTQDKLAGDVCVDAGDQVVQQDAPPQG